jgi:hypothetical protein
LESIHASNCQELHCYGTRRLGLEPCVNGRSYLRSSSLRVLQINSPLLFTPRAVSFTLTILQNAPLQKLALTNTTFKPRQWSGLLSKLVLPQLSQLEVENTCPIPVLVDFLHRHKVRSLFIRHKDNLTLPILTSRSRSQTPLPSLAELDGSSAIILSLMRLVDISHPFQRLVVRLDSIPVQQNHLLDLLSCTEYFTDLQELQVNIPKDARNLLDYPEGDLRVCPAKSVSLRGPNPPSASTDVIVSSFLFAFIRFANSTVSQSHCAPWMQVFPNISQLWLHTCSDEPADDLRDMFQAFSPLGSNLPVHVLRF